MDGGGASDVNRLTLTASIQAAVTQLAAVQDSLKTALQSVDEPVGERSAAGTDDPRAQRQLLSELPWRAHALNAPSTFRLVDNHGFAVRKKPHTAIPDSSSNILPGIDEVESAHREAGTASVASGSDPLGLVHSSGGAPTPAAAGEARSRALPVSRRGRDEESDAFLQAQAIQQLTMQELTHVLERKNSDVLTLREALSGMLAENDKLAAEAAEVADMRGRVDALDSTIVHLSILAKCRAVESRREAATQTA